MGTLTMHRPRSRPPLAVRLVAVLPLAVLAGPALLAGPAAAQNADDWRSAPLAIPSGAAPGDTPAQPLQAPAEVRRPQMPLQPGQPLPEAPAPWPGNPTIRVAPGAGVRPQPRPQLRAQPQPPLQPQATPAPPKAAPPAPQPSVRIIRVPVSTPAPPPTTPPRPAGPKVRSFLETLPPGTIQPLPGETLPGSVPQGAARAPQAPAPAAPQTPQVVPPPPWANRRGESERQDAPWIWLVLGLGIGGAAVFLLQERRRDAPAPETASTLGIRVEARPDPGVQTLRPAAPHGETPRGTGGE
jgi:hypothetical protein